MNEWVPAACFVLAALCFFQTVWGVVWGLLSRSWPGADGVIRASTMVKKRNSEDDEVYRQKIEYSYVVLAKKYRGTRIRFGMPRFMEWSTPSQAPLKVGDSVVVYHSSSHPSMSVLRRGMSWVAFLPLVTGCALLWLGVRSLSVAV
jgi:hypothetical protein